MRILPLHDPLIEAGMIGFIVLLLGFISFVFVLVQQLGRSMDAASIAVMSVLMSFLATPILLHALVVSQRVAESCSALRSFTISECGCQDHTHTHSALTHTLHLPSVHRHH